MPRLKIDIQKVQYLKQCQKLLSSLLPGLEVFCRDKRCHLYSYVSQNLREIGTLSAFCVNRDTTGTNAKIPGLSRSFRDTWQLCVLVGHIIVHYCDLRGRIKGTARALYPVFVERALWPILSGHKAR